MTNLADWEAAPLLVELGVGQSAQFTTWHDISGRLIEFHPQRGRTFELDRVETGTASLKLENTDRSLDWTYAPNPYNAAGTVASLTTALGGNRDLKFTSTDTGLEWNSVTVTYERQPSIGPFRLMQVSTSGTPGYAWDIHVKTATDGSTAAEVMAALQGDPTISRYLTVALAPGSDGSGVLDVNYGPASLSGGTDHVQLDIYTRVRVGLAPGTLGLGSYLGLFFGFVTEWDMDWNLDETTVDVQAQDIMGVLAQINLPASSVFPTQLTGERIRQVLAAVGWAGTYAVTTAPNVDDGTVLIDSYTPGQGVTALEAIQQAVDTEVGAFFIDGGGNYRFQNKYQRFSNTAPRYIFGDLDGGTEGDPTTYENEYTAARPRLAADRIINDVSVGWGSFGAAAKGISNQEVEDARSEDRYGIRSRTIASSLSTLGEAANLAAGIIWLYKDPGTQIPELDIQPTGDQTLLLRAFSLEIGDRIRVRGRPKNLVTNDSTEFEFDHYIEQVKMDFVQGEPYQFSYALSPAFPASKVNWLILDDPVHGTLDTDNLIGF